MQKRNVTGGGLTVTTMQDAPLGSNLLSQVLSTPFKFHEISYNS